MAGGFIPDRLAPCFDGARSVADGVRRRGPPRVWRARRRAFGLPRLLWAEFDRVGDEIEHFRTCEAVGPSHRYISTPGARLPFCVQTAVAPRAGTVWRLNDNGFRIRVEAPVPLTPARIGDIPADELRLVAPICPLPAACAAIAEIGTTPPIDGQLEGRFLDGELVIGATTDSLPSHGFAVTVDGKRKAGAIMNTPALRGLRRAAAWRDSRCDGRLDVPEGAVPPNSLGALGPAAQTYALTLGLRYSDRIQP